MVGNGRGNSPIFFFYIGTAQAFHWRSQWGSAPACVPAPGSEGTREAEGKVELTRIRN